MEHPWKRIESWLATKAPHILAELNPPASARQLAETKQFLGVQFPEVVRATYLRHNGQTGGGMLDGREWLSPERIRRKWKARRDLFASGQFEGIQSKGNGVYLLHLSAQF
ncbi:MAG: SMI1/KNR4 family protein [Gemmataceae bacterium]